MVKQIAQKLMIILMISMLLSVNLFANNVIAVDETANETTNETMSEASDSLGLTAKAAILMEATTGTIIYEKNAHEQLRPASVTKVMTLLLIYEAVARGDISWDDEVVVSAHAASMGGSQVYLEANEVQTVATLTKCIAVASANDGAMAMAEYIGGSEEGFVNMMNEKARELGMVDTHFVNPSGLDADDHYTSAYDIAVMSRELTTKFPEIFDLTTIWMDKIIHSTARGDEEFGLTNTNKLLQWYEGTTGLKTGSTEKAKYCLSGTATRNNLDLIAVIMAAPDYKTRFEEVMTLFDHGFAVCQKYEDLIGGSVMTPINVIRGEKECIDLVAMADYKMIITEKDFDENNITKEILIPEIIEAPIVKDQKIGDIVYTYDGQEIGRVDLIASEAVEKATFTFYMKKIFSFYFQ
jgi:D-alanyl-D-alanine carboxypeptidase (penicillin-binding protein 5/6)